MPTIWAAAATADLAVIRDLLDSGADIDAQDAIGRTPAMTATYNHQVEVARLLFDRGASPNIRDANLNNPFLYAGAEGFLDILKLANDAGADPSITNRYGGVALIPASERGHVEVVRYLLEETETDVNHVNDLGWTALLEAIILSDGGPRHQEIVSLLIDYDADLTLADNDGATPLAHARQRGFSQIAELLIAAGATDRT